MEKGRDTGAKRRCGVGFWLAVACIALSGCGGFSTIVAQTEPSGLEQMLIVRSLERAVDQLDLAQYAGRRIHLDLFTMIEDGNYAWHYVATQLEQLGAKVVLPSETAGVRLKVFASVMGIDTAENFFGLPAIPTPLFGLAIPAVNLYKSVRNRGYTELKVYAFDSRTGEFLGEESPRSAGKSQYNRYTLLILLSFTLSDLDRAMP